MLGEARSGCPTWFRFTDIREGNIAGSNWPDDDGRKTAEARDILDQPLAISGCLFTWQFHMMCRSTIVLADKHV